MNPLSSSFKTVLCSLFFAFVPFAGVAFGVEVIDPRVEYRQDPLGIDVTQPRLGWKLASEERGVSQQAYRILVASSLELLKADKGDLWDSGKVTSDASIQIAYGGKTPASRQHCHWKVRVWDQDDKPSEWSESALWSMGLLSPSDWKAKGHYDSIHGRIASDWKVEGDTFRWKLEVPANTTATLSIPARSIDSITEGGKPIDISSVERRMEAGRTVLRVGSGNYGITATGVGK